MNIQTMRIVIGFEPPIRKWRWSVIGEVPNAGIQPIKFGAEDSFDEVVSRAYSEFLRIANAGAQ